ncbi:MAG: preprotein translocase subunit SecE [Armatimonadetes bacterium]|nr:preprotein translocase subunit SecE [Armatimonadota bacterium]
MKTTMQERVAGATRAPSFWSKLKAFFRDSWLELQKVIWPSYEDVMKMTGLVVVVVFVVGIFIFLWDRILWMATRSLFE